MLVYKRYVHVNLVICDSAQQSCTGVPREGGGETQARAEWFLLRCNQTHCEGPKGF